MKGEGAENNHQLLLDSIRLRKQQQREIQKQEEKHIRDDSQKLGTQQLHCIIRDMEAWNPNFRSRTAVITTPTRHFVDTSIACGALDMSPDDLINDLRSFGMFFEHYAVNQLRICSSAQGGEVRHYRDSKGLECDAVVHLRDGRYALVEIKLGGENLIKSGISTLSSLKRKIEADGFISPTLSMILTACSNAYTAKEGIHMVPVNKLRDRGRYPFQWCDRKFYINFLTCCKMKYVKAKWTENEAPVSVID